MERRHCLLLLCALGFTFGERMKNDDFVSILRRFQPGLLVRDEPYLANEDFEINSQKRLRPPEFIPILEQTKNSLSRRDANEAPGPMVLTKDGKMKGVTVDKAQVFYGIPYADPPVGAYRWKPPRPVTPWKEVYDASFPRAACMQACSGPVAAECSRTVSEDCLYLNVFVPLDVDFNAPLQSLLPVMVWIHGGDFIAGSASKPLYDGRFISNFTHTVVVSMEYRLGAFGFLVSGKDAHTSAVGNYGILDQQAALVWVQRNIAVFGGDPSKVTVFGESAGAQSVCLHLMIQSSKLLFKQAMLQSVPFSIPLKSRHDALKLGKDFAKETNCSVNNIVCLLSLTPQAVLNAQMKTSSKIVNPFKFLEVFETWGPYIDGDLIKEQTVTAFQKGHWQKEKSVLLGTTSEEGLIFVYSVFHKPVSAVESTVYITAIFKQHAIGILRKYLPLYREADHRGMLAQVGRLPKQFHTVFVMVIEPKAVENTCIQLRL
ncbi:cAMP-regulated D2 protein-like [Takifugu rubripes]|uniref:cAMP-regulated D2 protein-like n=1 Tax=Takifugu rubripes TaxID=31033 RepID=UPI001146098B|nr:cAMP-regulated D2 protein-like [Takifugu rubripes]